MSNFRTRMSRSSCGPHRARRTAASIVVAALSVAAGMFGAPSPASAEEGVCPSGASHPTIMSWATTYSDRAVTVCQAWDRASGKKVHVQVVDFEAGGKMRVMSDPWEPAWDDTRFTTRTAWGWFDWVGDHVATPAPSRLFSVTNGSFSISQNVWMPESTSMSFPQKKWNTLTSWGIDEQCHYHEGGSAKRYFGLSDPRTTGRQFPYIDTYDDPCQSNAATANEEFSSYQGKPVSLFDATVGYHPLVETSKGPQRQTFLGTLSTDGRWTGTQDRAYLLTSDFEMTAAEARDILANDFGTMYNVQLSGGTDTQYQSVAGYMQSFEPGGRLREVPEVLVIYNA